MQYGQIQYSSAPNSLNGLLRAYVAYAVDQFVEALRYKPKGQPPIFLSL